MHWEVEELEKALYEDDIRLAKRYLSKLKEKLFCVKCKKPIRWQPVPPHGDPVTNDPANEYKGVVNYFKGYIHVECQGK